MCGVFSNRPQFAVVSFAFSAVVRGSTAFAPPPVHSGRRANKYFPRELYMGSRLGSGAHLRPADAQ